MALKTNMEGALKDKKWKEFVIGKIFSVYSTSSGIDKNKLRNKSGNIPYITRTEQNNGYDIFVDTQNEKYKISKGNVITIGLDTQTVFYQQTSFYTGQNIQILESAGLNSTIAKFLIPLLKKQMVKFNWGGNGATLTRLRKTKILLPINDDNQPDYQFMTAYIEKIENAKRIHYSNFIEKRLENLKNTLKPISLKDMRWKEFFIEDVFFVKSGKRLVKSEMHKGIIPFIGASDSNNGVTEFISNKNVSLDKNVLGVNYNGSVVENFYHPYEAIFSDDVKRVSFRNITGNRYVYLFIKNIILKQKAKYEYGYKFNGERMKRQKILLPITESEVPDYSYMENYIKYLELNKLMLLKI